MHNNFEQICKYFVENGNQVCQRKKLPVSNENWQNSHSDAGFESRIPVKTQIYFSVDCDIFRNGLVCISSCVLSEVIEAMLFNNKLA